MRLRRGGSNLSGSRSARATFKYTIPLFSLLFVSVTTPLLFMTTQIGIFRSSPDGKEFITGMDNAVSKEGDLKTQNRKDVSFETSGFAQIERMFPEDVIHAIVANVDDSGPLSLNAANRKDLSASWVITNSMVPVASSSKTENLTESVESEKSIGAASTQSTDREVIENDGASNTQSTGREAIGNNEARQSTDEGASQNKLSAGQTARRKMRMQRKVKRLRELTQKDDLPAEKIQRVLKERTRNIISDNVMNKYSIWRKEVDENSESLVRLMRDQLIMAKVYASIAQAHNRQDLLRDLRLRIRESQRVLGEANQDSDLPHSASERIKAMGQALSNAREQLYDCTGISKKLRAMLQLSEDKARGLKKQSTFLSQLAAKTLPKGIHCLSMRLTIDYYQLPEQEREFPGVEKLEDPTLFHYALFSDNVLAASVVVNSTVRNAKEPRKHVFHLVTDKLNYPAMKMWFLANPPGEATIEVQNIDDFTWLNSSYCPVLRQLESAAMKEYYFKADRPASLAAGSSNLKYRNPKYLSMLNHLRFYLPEVYPKLDKILFLDDDIVVQKDLTPLWSVDLDGKVNGAVETCGRSFHRFDKYLNFSNPLIKRHFDPRACGWAYGMNIFDLNQWKKMNITGIYHKWQNLNEDRVLWKLGTLPPGLITFYNLTHPLNKSWHVLGLGYNPSVGTGEIEGAAVVHYNGNMKPWLELGMAKYKHYWTRYVNYEHNFLQNCNIA